jgi:hypothetical protein|tara:strand:- start:371 stop:1075 length:705 start_codon:yes stop_codon:yes gene_type:complete
MKPCLIKQPAGIGDIFFCQKIAKLMIENGYDVIWPLRPDIYWIKDYIKGIDFPTTDDNFIGKDIYERGAGAVIEENGAFISLATADFTHNDGRIMSSKYSMLGLDHSDWKDYFKFDRKLEKENDLYYNVLGLKDDSEFVFINNLYNENRNCELLSSENYDLPAVELQYIEGFTLFDWCKVFEKAKSVYTINTSLNYIIDVLDTSYDEYVIIAHNERNVKEIDYLFSTPHKLICK